MEKKSVLLVDDDPMVRDIIKSALERKYNILEASSCSEAFKIINQHIDVAIIDYMLPDGDGFDILKTIRKINPELPAIIMTGFGHESIVIKAIRSEVADYIKKPLKLSYLRKRLSEIFGDKEEYKESEDLEHREEFIMEGAAAYIEENYNKDLKLDKLASMTCMNRFKFSRLFRKKFNQTYISYLNNIRIKNAIELLLNTDATITEIAKVVGYSNVTHFERIFKVLHGMSPNEYRKKLKKISKQN